MDLILAFQHFSHQNHHTEISKHWACPRLQDIVLILEDFGIVFNYFPLLAGLTTNQHSYFGYQIPPLPHRAPIYQTSSYATEVRNGLA